MPAIEPPPNCPLCPRLADFREENRRAHPGWFNAPVPGWGDDNPKLLIVGLAPGLQGANRTGRPFTGDYAGDLLFATLGKLGLARGDYDRRRDDGFELTGARICNAVHCVPPQNKPTGAEIATCRRYLVATIAAFPGAKVFLALGRIAHVSLLAALGERRAGFPFAHGARHELSGHRLLFDSYHCSRYNTNTGRLTAKMFEAVVEAAKAEAGM
ncbi:MAG: uracil-DNA glycosylase [Cucumibacter sp.]